MKTPTQSKASKRSRAVRKNAVPAVKRNPEAGTDKNFSIVGIGASAGGLEALVQFLERVEMGGGRFSIESVPGAGTAIRVVVPSDKPRKGK